MATVTVSDKGQVVIPAAIRHRLGIEPGTKLDFELEGDTIRVRPLRAISRTRPEDGYGLLRCDQPGGETPRRARRCNRHAQQRR